MGKLVPLFLILLLIFSSCSKYEITPGKQADFLRMPDGSKLIAEAISEEPDTKNIIQQPAAYLLKEPSASDSGSQSIYQITDDDVNRYIALLTDVLGFEMFYESLGYVYNTWYFVHPDSNKETGDYGTGYDIRLRYYYDYSAYKRWITVDIDSELYSFGDLGLRANGEYTRDIINGTYARDAFVLKFGKYCNYSDKKLSVKSGVKKESLYTYTKPFTSSMYGFYGYEGLCTLIINGGKPQSYDALLSDYEDFDSAKTDMISVSKGDGSCFVNITWDHKDLEVGQIYDLADFAGNSYYKFDFNYDYHEFTKTSALCLTVRPIWLDRTGACESVVYFYGEFLDEEGEIYTLEGLLAAPFCLEETSEKYDGSSTSSGNSGGFFDNIFGGGSSNIPEFAKQDCLTCRGDGDCNTCNGYGKVERYMGGGETVTASCPSCHGSGKCRSCGGTGKR